MTKRFQEKIINILLVCIASVLALIMSEGLYRAYLSTQLETMNPHNYAPNPKPNFKFFAPPGPWVYNPDYGFDFFANSQLSGEIVDGDFVQCTREDVINELGNLAHRPSRFNQTAIKGILVGSSYTMGTDDKERYFHEALEDLLVAKTGLDIAIENTSRGAFGIIQMFDLAATVLEQKKPDFLLIVFNTATLGMPRHWRSILPFKNGFSNLHFMTEPAGTTPTARNSYIHRFIVYDRVTEQWCAQMNGARKSGDKARLSNDPVISAMIKRHNEILENRNTPKITVDLTSLRRSFLFNRIYHRNAFWDMDIYADKMKTLMPLTIDSYGDDPKFMQSVTRIKATKIPVMLVHIPSFPELLKGDEWAGMGVGGLPMSREISLAASITSASQLKIESLLAGSGAPREDAADFAIKASGEGQDWHPNKAGIDLYTKALSELMLDKFKDVLH